MIGNQAVCIIKPAGIGCCIGPGYEVSRCAKSVARLEHLPVRTAWSMRPSRDSGSYN